MAIADHEHSQSDQKRRSRSGQHAPDIEILDVESQITGERYHCDTQRKAYRQFAGVVVQPDHRENFQVQKHQEQIGQCHFAILDHQRHFVVTGYYGCVG
jgi:hypothetical protein